MIMIPETFIIAGSAASVGFIHTILGPDHYLPLVAMAKTNGWSGPKTASYTAFCGFSHVFGTILIGSLVFLFGLAFYGVACGDGGLLAHSPSEENLRLSNIFSYAAAILRGTETTFSLQ